MGDVGREAAEDLAPGTGSEEKWVEGYLCVGSRVLWAGTKLL